MGMGVDPNVKRITRVSRTGVLIGLGFLVVGLLFAIAPPGPTSISDIAIGCVLMFLGASFICFRVGVMLDRQRRTVTTWWGLLVPFNVTKHPISPAHFVSISREERSDYKRSYEVFPVRLERAVADSITIQELTIDEPREHDMARHLAEDVAKFIQLGVRDRSSGAEIIREAGALDQSLQQRLGPAVSSMPPPAQPPQARAIFKYGGTRVPTTIEIPPIGRSGYWFLQTIFAACVAAIASELSVWLRLVPEEAAVRIAVGMPAFITLALVLMALGFCLPPLLRTAILREHLIVSPDKLIVTRGDIFGTKTTRLMGSEIEEVEVTDARHGIYRGLATFGGGRDRVVIRSDRGSIALGAALSNPEEIKWLKDVLVHVLNSVPP